MRVSAFSSRLAGVITLAVIAAQAAVAQVATLVDDTFGDGERSTQNLPASLAWYTPAAAAGSIGVRNGGLTLVANENDRRIWGYFPTLDLAIGDSLTLAVTFSFSRAAPNLGGPGFKIALCHTNGQAPRRSDGATPAGGYLGYGMFTNQGAATNGTRIRKRNGPAAANATATLLELTDGATDVVWAPVGTSPGGISGTLQAGTTYTATLRITRRTADSARITVSMTGGAFTSAASLAETDPSGIVSLFDTLAIEAAETAQAGDLVISRISLLHEVNTARLSNLSILTSVDTPGENFSLGYVVGGSGTTGVKPLLLRAAGPSLTPLGVTGTLDDPRLELFAGATRTDENNDWQGTPAVAAAMSALGAFPFTSPASRDAALLAQVSTPDNSVRVSANGNGTGTVIAEVYDATPTASFSKSTPRLINVSVLKQLGNGLTVGFTVAGQGTKTVLVRAVGPTLGNAPFFVGGAAVDPQLELFTGTTRIAGNDNWGGGADLAAAFAQVGAFELSATSRDAALLAGVSAGSYTVRVSGVNNSTGVALVEVYEVP